jgi:hypothetical protein
MLIAILLQACSMMAPEKEMMDAFEQMAKYERNILSTSIYTHAITTENLYVVSLFRAGNL